MNEAGLRSTYGYDDFGNVTSIVTPGNGQSGAEYRYDEFERMIGGHDAGQADEQFTYDGLDRRDSKTAAGVTWDLSYVGTSETLSQEQRRTAAGAVLETRSYDYDADREALGQSVRAATPSYRTYTKDANGSILGLEDGRGHVQNGTEVNSQGRSERIDYDPYGETRNEAQLSAVARANPLRFEGFYYDAALKSYDMRARAYRPDIGRFLTQDRYEAASADLNLQTDHLTQDRYAFAGGNPVNNVEWDGHACLPCLYGAAVVAAHVGRIAARGGTTARVVHRGRAVQISVQAAKQALRSGVRIQSKVPNGYNHVYTIKNRHGAVVYVGRTRDFFARAKAHNRGQFPTNEGYRVERLNIPVLARRDAKSVEQALIQRYGMRTPVGGTKRGQLLNARNEISRRNPVYRRRVREGDRILDTFDPFRNPAGIGMTFP